MSGYELLKIIRSKDPLSSIYFLTGTIEPDAKKLAIAAGADDFIFKPFNSEYLVTKLFNAKIKNQSIEDIHIEMGLKLVKEGFLLMKDGIKTSLTQREFRVIELLINSDSTVSASEIASHLNNETAEEHISVLIHVIRKKISPLKMDIKNIRSNGYRIYY